MSLLNPALYMDGGHHTGELLRGMLQDAARRNQGIGHSVDLKVTAMVAPTDQVQIAPGTAFITGVADPLQGSYWGMAPDVTVLDINPTGAAARSDLIIVRVEDPTYEGNRAPDVDAFHADVIQGVAAGATTVPAGMSAIPLARIDIPANTAAITNAMIVDVRGLANARRDRQLIPVLPGVAIVAPHAIADWVDAGAVAVPSWATRVKVVGTLGSLKLIVGDFAGWVSLSLGGQATTQESSVDENWAASNNNPHRFQTLVAGSLVVPAAIRGTSQHWRFRARRTGGVGDIQADTGSTLLVDYEWFEGPE